MEGPINPANRPRAHPGARSVFSHIPPGPNNVPPIIGPISASTSSTTNTIRSLRLSLLTSTLTFLSLIGFDCATIWRGGRTIITLKWNRRWNNCASETGTGDYTEAVRIGALWVRRIGATVCYYGISPNSRAWATAWMRLLTPSFLKT